MVTISSHGWLMALFYPHPNDQQALCCRSINSRCDPLQILWGCIDGQASEAWKTAFATLWLLQKTKEWNKQENQHIHWLVVDLRLWKYEFVSWGYDIPNWMESHKKCSKPPTRSIYTWISNHCCKTSHNYFLKTCQMPICQSIHVCSCFFRLNWICINCQYPRNTTCLGCQLHPKPVALHKTREIWFQFEHEGVLMRSNLCLFGYETILNATDHVSHRLLLRINDILYQSCSDRITNDIVLHASYKINQS